MSGDAPGGGMRRLPNAGGGPAPADADPRHALAALAALTPARVALGRTGASLPTARHLELQLAHARARDAVRHPFDADALARALADAAGTLAAAGHAVGSPGTPDVPPVLRVRSAAGDRRDYLERPDLGRRLHPDDERALAATARAARAAPASGADAAAPWELALVIGDGLAPLAAGRHAPGLVRALGAALGRVPGAPWRIAPPVVATGARVALGDAVAAALGTPLVAVLLGERPGLSATDSLGVYVTHAPRPGRTTDAERACISNVRPEGLPVAAAAAQLAALLTAARAGRGTGVAGTGGGGGRVALPTGAQPRGPAIP